MRASDFLAAITVEPFERPYQEVCFQNDEKLVPVTSVRLEQEKLVLFQAEGSPSLPMKELVLQLMLNRKAHLYISQGGQLQPVYGFREDQGRLIL